MLNKSDKIKNKQLKETVITLILFGVLLLGFGIIAPILGFNIERKFMETAIQTQAVVDKIVKTGFVDDSDYSVYVHFGDNNDNIINSVIYFSFVPVFFVGDTIDVWYQPDNPDYLRVQTKKSSIIVYIIFVIIGAVLIIIGIIFSKRIKNK